jgi:hypothetical protein
VTWGGPNSPGEKAPATTKTANRVSPDAQIECVTPDGQSSQVARLSAQDPNASALIMDDGTVTCILQEGETDFVIELPQNAPLDRLTFLNENGTARGELKIAVANHRLSAKSSEWSEVDGIIPFAHKRLFGVSLMGIEARFVRLSFHIEKEGKIAALATYGDRSGEPSHSSSPASEPVKAFQASALEDALNSKFATLHSRGGEPLLSSNSSSVAPLP